MSLLPRTDLLFTSSSFRFLLNLLSVVYPFPCGRSYHTMEIATAKGPLREHVLWALNKQKGEEHVTLPNFVHKFGYTNKDSASLAYSVLIENSQVEIRRSERLQEAFKEFRLNSEEMFWSEVESRVDTALSSRKSGMITRAAGLRQAAQDYDSHFEDIKSSTTHSGLQLNLLYRQQMKVMFLAATMRVFQVKDIK